MRQKNHGGTPKHTWDASGIIHRWQCENKNGKVSGSDPLAINYTYSLTAEVAYHVRKIETNMLWSNCLRDQCVRVLFCERTSFDHSLVLGDMCRISSVMAKFKREQKATLHILFSLCLVSGLCVWVTARLECVWVGNIVQCTCIYAWFSVWYENRERHCKKKNK